MFVINYTCNCRLCGIGVCFSCVLLLTFEKLLVMVTGSGAEGAQTGR